MGIKGKRRKSRVGVIGLVGPVGAGKSTVAKFFGKLGARVIDADRLAHDAINSPGIRRAIVRRWGTGFVDREKRIDRAKVGAKVFKNPRELRWLERKIHPWVGREMTRRLRGIADGRRKRWAVLDVPLLVEAGLDKRCDLLVYVSAARETCRSRVKARGWSEAERKRRQALQMKLPLKKMLCAYEIHNDRSLRETERHVRRVWNAITRKGTPE
jgi:dephospho-CoA kinase